MRLIAAGGRKTTPGEKNYPPTKGELAAIVNALRAHKHILRYKPFVVYSDHSSLQWLSTMKQPRGIFARWLMELATYHFQVKHVPRKETGAADGLSRSDHLHPPPTQEELEEEDEYVAALGYVGEAKGTKEVELNNSMIKRAQENDTILKEVRRWLEGNKPTSKGIRGLPADAWYYYRLLNVLKLDNQGLLRITKISGRDAKEERERIIIPTNPKLRHEVFSWSHQHISAGHFGQTATCA